MKFMHLSDLHSGKRVNEYSMLEDQEYILKKSYEIQASAGGIKLDTMFVDEGFGSAEAKQI